MRARLLVVALVSSVDALWSIEFMTTRHGHAQIRREMNGRAQALKREADALFPVGVPEADVVGFLKRRAVGFHGEGPDGYWASVGQVPSRVWYCGPWEVGIQAKFKDKRLVETVVTTWSLNCP